MHTGDTPLRRVSPLDGGDRMKYQTPHGAILNLPEQDGALYLGMVLRDGVWHQIAVLIEDGNRRLVSGATFYGWVGRDEVITGSLPAK